MSRVFIPNLFLALFFFILVDFFLIEKEILYNQHLTNYINKFNNPFLKNDFYQRFSTAALVYMIKNFIIFNKFDVLTISTFLNKFYIFLLIFISCIKLDTLSKKNKYFWLIYLFSTPTFAFSLIYEVYFIALGQLLIFLLIISKNKTFKNILLLFTILNHPIFLFYLPLIFYVNNKLSSSKITIRGIFVILFIYSIFLLSIILFGIQDYEVQSEYFTQLSLNYNISPSNNVILNEILFRFVFMYKAIQNQILSIPILLIFSLELLWVGIAKFYKNLGNKKDKNLLIIFLFFLIIMFGFGEDTTKYLLPLYTIALSIIILDKKVFYYLDNKIKLLSIGNLLIINIYGFAGNYTISNNIIIDKIIN